jgi:hypothetical protein
MTRAVVRALAALAAACLALAAGAQQPPVNLVTATEDIVTSGQPAAAWLASLKANGFGAVIYLAPVWVPHGTWKDFIAAELQRASIAFDPF